MRLRSASTSSATGAAAEDAAADGPAPAAAGRIEASLNDRTTAKNKTRALNVTKRNSARLRLVQHGTGFYSVQEPAAYAGRGGEPVKNTNNENLLNGLTPSQNDHDPPLLPLDGSGARCPPRLAPFL
jgi:hypothetical protein